MMKGTLLAALFFGLSGLPAFAEYTVKGSISCANAVQEDSHQHFREYNKWWLLGYFTARNYVSDQVTGQGIEDESIYQMAMNFCKANPSNDWDDAAIHTYDLLD